MSQSLMADVVTPNRIRLVTLISDTRSMAIVVIGFSIVHIVAPFGIVVNGKVIIACLTSRPQGDIISASMTCGQADIVVARILVGIVP